MCIKAPPWALTAPIFSISRPSPKPVRAVPDVVAWLKQLEQSLGRDPGKPSYSSRPIDIDVFIPDAVTGAHQSLTVSAAEIRENAFLLRPLSELLPELRLAPDAPALAELWARHDKSTQPLTRVQLDLPEILEDYLLPSRWPRA